MTLERSGSDWRHELDAVSAVGDEARDAERVDAALSASRSAPPAGQSGIDREGLRAALGAEAVELAGVAARLVDPSAWTLPAPAAGFAHALEARLVAAFEQHAAETAPARIASSRHGRLPEMLLVGGAAAALAVAAFLINPGRGIAPEPPPTVEAATETATLVSSATPEVALTVEPGDAATSEGAMSEGAMSEGAMSGTSATQSADASASDLAGDEGKALLRRLQRRVDWDSSSLRRQASPSLPRFGCRYQTCRYEPGSRRAERLPPLSVPSSLPHGGISGTDDNAGMNTSTNRLVAHRTVHRPNRFRTKVATRDFIRSAPLVWDLPPATIDAPLPTRATFEAGKAALMARAAAKRVERAAQVERPERARRLAA